MIRSVSHDRNDESMEAKAKWFATLSHEERFAIMCEFAEMALRRQPHLGRATDVARLNYAHTPPERIQIVSRP